MNAEDEDELAGLNKRLHAARWALREAYDQRDTLAGKSGVADRDPDARARPELLMALSAAERAVLEAEAEMKDAEYALAVAQERDERAGSSMG